jgi:solute carrier family 25 phosphate transporter 23/24/25/41
MGIAPLVAINFTTYERLKQHAREFTDSKEVPVSFRLACGGLAGAIAQTVTYPLDVLRRRLQSSGLLGFNYTGVLDAATRMYHEEGPRSFYRGLLPNYLKVVPAISVSFVVYEAMQSLLR